MRTVIITGGTGALGRAVVRVFLDAGDRVVVPWIAKGERDEVEQLWEADRVTLIEADIAEVSGAARVANGLESIDVLVNTAGGFAGGSPVDETDLEVWDDMFRINVRTAVAMTQAVLSRMRGQGRGVILNVASRAAFDQPPGLSAYNAAKAAVAVLTRTLQKEVADLEIRVNAVVPTTIDTPANRQAMPDADFALWTAPERIASVLLWLASDAAASVRGGLIPV